MGRWQGGGNGVRVLLMQSQGSHSTANNVQLPCCSPPLTTLCSQSRADAIAAQTDIDGQTAARIAAFFQRGGRQPAPLGLQLGAHLQSL